MASVQELTKEIEQLTVAIEQAKTQIAEFQQMLAKTSESGKPLLGDTAGLEQAKAAIAQLKASIDSMIASREKLSAQKADLVNENNIKSVESLSKAITTLKTQLDDLYVKRTGALNLFNTTGDMGQLRELDLQIKNLETHIQSFETRKNNLTKVAGEYIAGGAAPIGKQPAQPNAAPAIPSLEDYPETRAGNLRFIEDLRKAVPDAKAFAQALKEVGLTEEGFTQKEADAAKALAEQNELLIKNIGTLKELSVAQKEVIANWLKQHNVQGTTLGVQTTEGGNAAVVTAVSSVGGVTERASVTIDKFGNVVENVQRKFQNYTQGVIRDAVELSKWSIAIGLIYAPLNALNEMIQKTIQNQSALAEASIAVGDSLISMGTVFDAAATAAQKAGEDVNGVIAAFDLAYRATGKLVNETERYQVATKLMGDSLTLSKISTLNQAEANDTLSAALYQSGLGLDQGATLLDQWVRVSKIANVDVATLADGVAILGNSAELAGLSTKQLNALVATLAETSKLSGATAANAAKSLIGTYQSPEAEKALARIGVAVKDSTGNVRDFISVMQQVANLQASGVISDQAFSQVTLALGGGGIRNQKNVSAFLTSFEEYNRIASSQENTQGEAAAALAKQLDTVQTATTRLGNAFQKLGMSLGTKGGLLDDFTAIVNAATQLIEVLTKLTDVLGKSSPLLLGMGLSALFSGGKGPVGSILGQFANFAPGLARQQQGNMLFAPGIQAGIGGTGIPQIGFGTRLGLAAGAIAIPAAQNIANKDYTEAGANVAGGVVGFLVGGPGGALIGSTIAEAFVRSTIDYKPEFVNLFAGATKASAAEKPPTTTDTEKLNQEIYKSLGGNLGTWFGELRAALQKEASRGYIGEGRFNTNEAAALSLIRRENPDLYRQVTGAAIRGGVEVPGIKSPAQAAQENIGNAATLEILRQLQEQRIKNVTAQVSTGQITSKEFVSQTTNIPGYVTAATQYLAAFGDTLKEVNPTLDQYKGILDLLTYGSQEQLDSINSLVADIQTAQNAIGTWTGPITQENALNIGGQKMTFNTQADLQKELELLQQQAARQFQTALQTSLVSQIKLPSVVGPEVGKGISPKDLQYVIEETRKNQEKFFASAGGGNLNPQQIAALEASFDKFSVLVTDGANSWYETIDKTDQKFYQETIKAAQDAGKILSQQPLGLTSFQVNMAQWEQIMNQQYPALKQQAMAAGYVPQEETQIVHLDDGQFIQQTFDSKLIQILLQELNDKAQKQLDGMYNIPEGATFWVPITAAYYRPKNENTGIDLSALNAALTPNTVSTDLNTAALIALTTAIGPNGEKKYSPEFLRQNLTPEEQKLAYSSVTGPSSSFSMNENVTSVRPFAYSYGQTPTTPITTVAPNLGFQTPQTSNYTPPTTADLSILDSLKNLLQNLFNAMPQGLTPFKPSTITPTLGQMGATQQNAQPVSTKLDLKIDSSTQLIVDGRVLAEIIKPYLVADLLQSQQTQSTTTRQYII